MLMNIHSGLRLCIVSLLALILLAACAARTPLRSDGKKAGQGYPPDCKWLLACGNSGDTVIVLLGMRPRYGIWWLAKRKTTMQWDVSARQGTVLYDATEGYSLRGTDTVEVAELGGRVLRRTDGYLWSNFAFNATGDKVALIGYRGEESMGLYVWDMKDGELRRLNETLYEEGREVTPGGVIPGRTSTDFSWVGDDKIVAVWLEKSIESLNLSTGKRTKLVSPGTQPCASPDGRYLAYNRSDRLVLRNLTTGEEDDLGPFEDFMAWSPDSAFFAYLGRNVYESSTHGWIPVEIVLMRLADRAKYVIDEYYAYTWQFPRFVDRKTLDRLNPMGIPAPPSPAAVEQK